MMIIPEGCAHGFQVLEPESELLYLHSVPYAPDAECGLSATDPRLAIAWPLTITERSARDSAFSPLRPDFAGIEL
jgi:dTDP-4-dehydrorhamnose 3,5-epimerase